MVTGISTLPLYSGEGGAGGKSLRNFLEGKKGPKQLSGVKEFIYIIMEKVFTSVYICQNVLNWIHQVYVIVYTVYLGARGTAQW